MNALESFLLGITPAKDLPAGAMTDFRLLPLFYSSLPADHPEKPKFRNAFLASTARHARIKSHVLELIRAWNAAGIVPMLFKGFMMAEFVYDLPAIRFYGDVDIVVQEHEAAKAAKIAKELPGWVETWNRADTVLPNIHEESHLFTTDHSVRLDLHRFALHTFTSAKNAQRLTNAMWANSSQIAWEGCQVALPSSEDAALMGVVLSRMWDESPGVKPHDVLDFAALSKKWGLSREALVSRAGHFGLEKPLETFLRLCDPWEQKLDYKRLSQEKLKIWRNSFPTSWQLEWRLARFDRLVRAIPTLLDVATQYSNVVRVKKLLREKTDLFEIVAANEPNLRVQQNKSFKHLERIMRGIHWTLVLIGPRFDACVPRSLAVYNALKAEGHDVVFVSGVRRNNGKLEGHAWVELNGIGLEIFNDVPSAQIFKENFRYPKPENLAARENQSLELVS
jgi:Uncharacterised nucleotidyltransferase/Transglutaminase-like superfamily